MVVRPRRHRRRLPDLPDGRRLAHQAGAVRGGRRQHHPRRFPAQGPAHHSRSRGDRAVRDQFRTGEEQGDRKGPVGARVHQAQHRRQRRLQGHDLERRQRSHPGAQRQLERRPAAESPPRDLAHGAVGRQPARALGTRRRRHLLRSAEQGLRRAARGRQAQHRVDALLERHPIHRHECEEPAVRQSQGSAGGGLRDPVSEDHGRGAVRPRQADVRCGRRRQHHAGLAAGAQVQHRPRQGEAAPGRSRLPGRVSRPRSRSTSGSPA